ncbi:hypothetical protein COU20_01105 [Candidatus Kaiserbacteria bacterium CG10_big_fil_rev_8_21_14_0_10_59_10]|uniref:Uncharacterized protein n=1 Tax=Candidatus Kaiserbacteria bacterium CG10_big_fil_rev_8_21_14_0_10_59_10 TaxID=1974612 RepID=A0A2H0U8E2_9BACT|nr:MAG: hypothetical protein COU20_01105 [Candidatus Kaiserbacteria bacterium CG10_big_fil_rev_8_21_14_0_10_59_10]
MSSTEPLNGGGQEKLDPLRVVLIVAAAIATALVVIAGIMYLQMRNEGAFGWPYKVADEEQSAGDRMRILAELSAQAGEQPPREEREQVLKELSVQMDEPAMSREERMQTLRALNP